MSTLVDRQAEAAPYDDVPAIRVGQLGSFKGQTLTVMYVLGSKPIIALNPQQVFVSKVKLVKSFTIDQDQLQIDAVQIEKENFRGSYNMILLLVSAQANPIWENADGSIPSGQSSSVVTDHRQLSRVNVINKADADAVISAPGNNFLDWSLK